MNTLEARYLAREIVVTTMAETAIDEAKAQSSLYGEEHPAECQAVLDLFMAESPMLLTSARTDELIEASGNYFAVLMRARRLKDNFVRLVDLTQATNHREINMRLSNAKFDLTSSFPRLGHYPPLLTQMIEKAPVEGDQEFLNRLDFTSSKMPLMVRLRKDLAPDFLDLKEYFDGTMVGLTPTRVEGVYVRYRYLPDQDFPVTSIRIKPINPTEPPLSRQMIRS